GAAPNRLYMETRRHRNGGGASDDTRAARQRSASSAPIRFSIGGCVENRDIRPDPENGATMNMCAVAGFASSGTRRAYASILRRALTRPSGEPTRRAAPASAAYSREREIANWMSIAAI